MRLYRIADGAHSQCCRIILAAIRFPVIHVIAVYFSNTQWFCKMERLIYCSDVLFQNFMQKCSQFRFHSNLVPDRNVIIHFLDNEYFSLRGNYFSVDFFFQIFRYPSICNGWIPENAMHKHSHSICPNFPHCSYCSKWEVEVEISWKATLISSNISRWFEWIVYATYLNQSCIKGFDRSLSGSTCRLDLAVTSNFFGPCVIRHFSWQR